MAMLWVCAGDEPERVRIEPLVDRRIVERAIGRTVGSRLPAEFEIWKDSLRHLGGDYEIMVNFPIDPQLN